jgi:thioredoxin-like negative regulator of GroEL
MHRLFVVLPLAIACSKSESKVRLEPEPVTATATRNTPDPCSEAKPHGTMKWIENNYAAALACAKAKQLPIVIDLWAPWCHTCLSMQTTVFADKSFEHDASKFVFVALDTDRDENAAAVAKFPPSAWPTFYVIGPDEKVLARFVGAASVAQFRAFLDNGQRAMAGGVVGADAHLLAAERHLQAKQLADAERELAAALEKAPPTWPRRPDALTSLIGVLDKQKKHVPCLELAEKAMDDIGNAASASDFLYHATACAKEREKDEADRVKKLRERAVARWQKLLADPTAPLTVDDRSDAMMNQRATLDALGNKEAAKQLAEKQRALLDDAAAKATTPVAAMTFNWPRAEVYAYLGRPLDLVPALEKSARDLPLEYDPPARLGWIYLKGDKLAEAATWTDKAIGLAYGPRKARVLAQRAEIAARQNDKAGERRFREQIVKTLEALPPTQTTPDAIAKAKQAVADLATTPK